MPGYRTHMAGGACVATIILLLLVGIGCVSFLHDYLLVFCCFLATIAGSLFPDIDIKSKGQNYFYWLVFFVLLYHYWYNRLDRCAMIALICILPLLSKHRGILHNVWFLTALIGACMMLVTYTCKVHAPTICLLLGFFLLGIISHLVLDMGVRRMLRLPWRR